jgi:hypothetical protein
MPFASVRERRRFGRLFEAARASPWFRSTGLQRTATVADVTEGSMRARAFERCVTRLCRVVEGFDSLPSSGSSQEIEREQGLSHLAP